MSSTATQFVIVGQVTPVICTEPPAFEIHTRSESADNNGTVTWTGTELTTEYDGFHCIFSATNTDVGTLTGSATTDGNATLDVVATITRSGGRAGAFCGTTATWTAAYKISKPSTLNVDSKVILSGEAPTGSVGETYTVTWKNTGGDSATINDETNSAETVAKTIGTACTTIAAGGSCTSRKIECLKKGEATITARDTTAGVVGEFTVKCNNILGRRPDHWQSR